MSRYQRIYNYIWRDLTFRALSDDGRTLFLYCLTSPHSNTLGIYRCPDLYIMEDLGWGRKRLNSAKKELSESSNVKFDEKKSLICVRQNLKHNPIENSNQVLYCLKILNSLEYSPIFQELNIEPLSKPFHKPLLERLGEQFRNCLVNQITDSKLQINSKENHTKDHNLQIVDNFSEEKKPEQKNNGAGNEKEGRTKPPGEVFLEEIISKQPKPSGSQKTLSEKQSQEKILKLSKLVEQIKKIYSQNQFNPIQYVKAHRAKQPIDLTILIFQKLITKKPELPGAYAKKIEREELTLYEHLTREGKPAP